MIVAASTLPLLGATTRWEVHEASRPELANARSCSADRRQLPDHAVKVSARLDPLVQRLASGHVGTPSSPRSDGGTLPDSSANGSARSPPKETEEGDGLLSEGFEGDDGRRTGTHRHPGTGALFNPGPTPLLHEPAGPEGGPVQPESLEVFSKEVGRLISRPAYPVPWREPVRVRRRAAPSRPPSRRSYRRRRGPAGRG